MKALTAILEGLYTISEVATNLFMVILFVIVNLGVFSRYLFNAPFIWTEELALFVLVWMVFLAGSLTIRRWENVRVTYFIEKLPHGVTVAIECASRLLVLAFLVFVLILSARIIPQVGPTEVAPALNISMLFPQMGLVVGLALMVVQMVGLLLETLVALKKPGAS
ncbi:MAG: Tripartite ATP-independent periplasmic transporter DctQ component [Bacteroidetes bacterium]|nr:Tripartite ATP-independent periplasmic transporter DctQ component [Bacteroidota bacterium]